MRKVIPSLLYTCLFPHSFDTLHIMHIVSFSLPIPSPLVSPLPSSAPPRFVSDIRAFLRSHPPSSYTALLTTRSRTALPHLHFHTARLSCGATSLTGAPPDILSAPAFAAACHAAVKVLAPGTTEAQLILFISDAGLDGSTDKGTWLHVYAEALQIGETYARDPITVEARGRPRSDAGIKNTAWVRMRMALEEVRSASARETVLLGPGENGGVLLEGLVTNFFVMTKCGKLYTAGDGDVLSGSVRDIVLRVAGNCGLDVVESAPAVASRSDFDAAFVTNAVQVVTAVLAIRFPRLGRCDEEFVLPWSKSAQFCIEKLRGLVWSTLLSESSDMVETGSTMQ